MKLTVVNCLIWKTLICKIYASTPESTFIFFESKSNNILNEEIIVKLNNRILVPVPINEYLDLEILENCQYSIYNYTTKFDLIPVEIAKTLKHSREIKIIYPPKNINFSRYLGFYCWLNDIPYEPKDCDDFYAYLLYYLSLFNCKNIKLLFKLFKDVRNRLEVNKNFIDKFLMKLYPFDKLVRLINCDSDQISVPIIAQRFKKLFYCQEIEELLVSDTYEIIYSNNLCREICLKNKFSEENKFVDKNKSFFEITKLTKDYVPEFKIKIYTSVVELAILKFQDLSIEKSTNKEDYSFKICHRLFEALEFLLTEHQTDEYCVINGYLYFEKICDKKLCYGEICDVRLFILYNHIYCKLIANGYAYPVYISKIYMRGDAFDAYEVINAIRLANTSELILSSNICVIKNEEDIDSIIQISKRVELNFDKDKQEVKITHTKRSTGMHSTPIFKKVFLIEDACSVIYMVKYISLGLEIFWGPLEAE